MNKDELLATIKMLLMQGDVGETLQDAYDNNVESLISDFYPDKSLCDLAISLTE